MILGVAHMKVRSRRQRRPPLGSTSANREIRGPDGETEYIAAHLGVLLRPYVWSAPEWSVVVESQSAVGWHRDVAQIASEMAGGTTFTSVSAESALWSGGVAGTTAREMDTANHQKPEEDRSR